MSAAQREPTPVAGIRRMPNDPRRAVNCVAAPLRAWTVRDLDTIDSVPRLVAAVGRSIREHGGERSSRHVDALLDERLAHAVADLAGTRQQST